ncbi:hypothetical protein diail_8184 [Diaporthe ilicicola]|nr:hypothetical protein diail_8184 [Diaporthe ilicicola]
MAPASSIASQLSQKPASKQATLFLGAVLLVVVVLIIAIVAFGSLRRLPGRILSRLTGLPLTIAIFKGRRAQWLYELHKQYGPVVQIEPGEVSVADPRHYRTIYSSPKTSHKDPAFYGGASLTGDDNIFQMVNQEQHAARRKLVAAPYSLQSIRKLEHMIKKKARNLAERFLTDASISRLGTAGAYELCTLFSFDVVCAAGFAKDFDRRDKALSVLRAMETSGPRFVFNTIFSPLKDASWNTNMPGRIGAVYSTERASTGTSPAAGFRRTFRTTYWHPSGTGSPDDLAVLRGAAYLNAAVKETMRLYPTIISTLPRKLDQPLHVDGFELPSGVTAGMQNYVHHRDPLVLPDPEAFRPEKWLGESDIQAMEAAFA